MIKHEKICRDNKSEPIDYAFEMKHANLKYKCHLITYFWTRRIYF